MGNSTYHFILLTKEASMKKQIIVIVGILLITGCAGTKAVSKSDVPEWYLNPPKYEGMFVGVGDHLGPSMSLSKQSATQRARAEIATAVETQVKSMLKNYLQQSGMGADASALQFTESVSKSVANTTLQGSVIDRTEIKDGRVFVMVTYDANGVKDQAKATARSAAKKQEALYNEFKARQGFEALDKEFDNMETTSSTSAPE